MPGYKRRRKTFKRKRTYKKKKTFTRKVKSLIARSIETKWKSTQATAVVDNVTASVIPINTMQRGDEVSQRTGNRIEQRGIRATFTIEPNGAAQLATRVRCMLVRDRQPNGVAIAGGDLFPAGTAAANRFYSDYNLNTVPRRYKIMWDRLFLLEREVPGVVTAGVTSVTLQQAKYFRKRWKLKGTTRYNDGNVGDVTDIITPAYYWVFFSSQAAGQAPAVFLDWNFLYKDA